MELQRKLLDSWAAFLEGQSNVSDWPPANGSFRPAPAISSDLAVPFDGALSFSIDRSAWPTFFDGGQKSALPRAGFLLELLGNLKKQVSNFRVARCNRKRKCYQRTGTQLSSVMRHRESKLAGRDWVPLAGLG